MPDPQPLLSAWRHLRLSAAAPDRVKSWDWLVLTASGPAQAALYRAQMEAMKRRGRLPSTTRTLVVEDPAGKRIGSGGATLNALRALVEQLGSSKAVAQARTLLIHAGGDSKRLPWASVVGKAFIPLPFAADPDQPCPTLCDHLAALCSGVPNHLPDGGLLTLSGDVVPLADLGLLTFPQQGLGVVTIPAPAGLASRHGVIGADGGNSVHTLLQKPDLESLKTHNALLPGGRALLDTGIWSFGSDALEPLAELSAQRDTMPSLLADGRELGLYDDIPGAVLAPIDEASDPLLTRPLGKQLRQAMTGLGLQSIPAPSLKFLHFGTGSELLQHLSAEWSGHISRRQLAACGPAVADDAVIMDSLIDPLARVGSGTVISQSRLSARSSIGRRCVIQGVDAPNEPLTLPDHHALWQVPMPHAAGVHWVTVWCGVDDNPKQADEEASLGNLPLNQWCQSHHITPSELWDAGQTHSLWTARLFPGNPHTPSLGLLEWMLSAEPSEAGRRMWRNAPRWSLAELAGGFAPDALLTSLQHRADRVAMSAISAVAEHAIDRNVTSLASDCSSSARAALLALANQLPDDAPVPSTRRHWLKADLLDAAGASLAADDERETAWQSIADRVQSYLDKQPPLSWPSPKTVAAGHSGVSHLSARIDLSGGWTDTPPICFDHPAAVLNIAVRFDDRPPIGAEVHFCDDPGIRLSLEGPKAPEPVDLTEAPGQAPIRLDDPYALPKSVLIACGLGAALPTDYGIHLHAWSNLPRGSGLGGSSILAAAMVEAVTSFCQSANDPQQTMHRVLTVEQLLSTGGGWQDQLGGLLPGAKLLTSVPVSPLRVDIQPLPMDAEMAQQLQNRLLIINTGITRLAKNVLQRVVGGYLSRRYHSTRTFRRLTAVAEQARDALGSGDLDTLADLIAETWKLNQTLDPHCSNPEVDERFAGLPGAWKLTGAGGGGFAIWLIPADLDPDQAKELAESRQLQVVDWHIG